MTAFIPPIEQFISFYQTAAGHHITEGVQHLLAKEHRFADISLAIGFTAPFHSSLTSEGTLCLHAMSYRQGALAIPSILHPFANVACLTHEASLPFSDNSFSLVYIAHLLEYLDHPNGLLREAWRVLKPEGKCILLLPYQYHPWRFQGTYPCYFGKAFSLSEIPLLLHQHCFHHIRTSLLAHYAPPLPLSKLPFKNSMTRFLQNGMMVAIAQKNQLGTIKTSIYNRCPGLVLEAN